MKYILIIIAFNLANPQEKGILAHKAFASYEQCIAAGAEMIEGAEKAAGNPKTLRVTGFCIEENDLLDRPTA